MHTFKTQLLLFTSVALTISACQNKHNVNTNKETVDSKISKNIQRINNNSQTFPSPCKSYSSSVVKDKSKIEQMLIKENKINHDMSKKEKLQIVDDYIKNKMTQGCKPTLKTHLPNTIKE